ncbi:MAG: 50S ribosomal protein L23 [Patescibacteria group bacterium]|nr:50S ribosomal protein L23 [Patescibacteria group bacterium]
MAIFGRKPKTENVKETQKPVVAQTPVSISVKTSPKHSGTILLSPRITEKGTLLGEHSAYVFDVAKGAGKREVAQAVEAVFKVRPRMVRMVRVPGKASVSRSTGRVGRSASGKKAYVYLKQGDKIDIV